MHTEARHSEAPGDPQRVMTAEPIPQDAQERQALHPGGLGWAVLLPLPEQGQALAQEGAASECSPWGAADGLVFSFNLGALSLFNIASCCAL